MVKENRNQYEPDEVTPPGATLSDTLEALGMSQAELSERLGKAKKTVNEIIKDKQRIMPDTALDLERVLGVPASFWLNRQSRYDDFLARRAFREHVLQEKDAYREWLQTIPYREMAKRGWIPNLRKGDELIRVLLSFFGVANLDQWNAIWSKPEVAFLKTKAFKENSGVLAAWLRRGERRVSAIEMPEYNAEVFRKRLQYVRTLISRDPSQYINEIPSECAKAGVAVLYVPQLSNLRVYGATRWLSGRPVMQLSLRGKRDDHYWFTLFHEASHILNGGRTRVFIESDDEIAQDQTAENAANRYAEETLIPSRQWSPFVQEFRAIPAGQIQEKKSVIVLFSTRIHVCPGVVVGRLQHEGVLPHNLYNGLKRSLPDPSEEN